MTAWRREIRAKMLKQDNTASQIAADARCFTLTAQSRTERQQEAAAVVLSQLQRAIETAV